MTWCSVEAQGLNLFTFYMQAKVCLEMEVNVILGKTFASSIRYFSLYENNSWSLITSGLKNFTSTFMKIKLGNANPPTGTIYSDIKLLHFQKPIS